MTPIYVSNKQVVVAMYKHRLRLSSVLLYFLKTIVSSFNGLIKSSAVVLPWISPYTCSKLIRLLHILAFELASAYEFILRLYGCSSSLLRSTQGGAHRLFYACLNFSRCTETQRTYQSRKQIRKDINQTVFEFLNLYCSPEVTHTEILSMRIITRCVFDW